MWDTASGFIPLFLREELSPQGFEDHSVIFEIASKYCISDSLVDYGG